MEKKSQLHTKTTTQSETKGKVRRIIDKIMSFKDMGEEAEAVSELTTEVVLDFNLEKSFVLKGNANADKH